MGLTGGSGLTPYAKKSVLSTNYIDFTSADANSANWGAAIHTRSIRSRS